MVPWLLVNANRRSYRLPWSSASPNNWKGPNWLSSGHTILPPLEAIPAGIHC